MEPLTKPLAYEEKNNSELEQDFIFISYCHADKDVVYSDLIRMNRYNARFWYDENVYAGDNWLERVTAIINSKHCRGVLFYLSPNSFYSLPMLQEVEIAKKKLQRMNPADPVFKIASINIGRKSAFETLKTLNVSEELFRGFLFAFDDKVHFIARYFDPKSDDHLEEMLAFFSGLNALPDEFSVISHYDGVQIIKYDGTNSNVIIPSVINKKKVNAIGIHAFEKNDHVKHVHVSEGITLIDDFAFYNCRNLEKIELPNSLKVIGYEAFCKCEKLREIVIPYNVRKIDSHAFYRCYNLTRVHINSLVPLTIKYAAFEECSALSTIKFPESLDIIEPYTFSNCVSLRSVLLPDNIKEIGHAAFHSCSNLREIYFKPDIVPENDGIFSRCLSLRSIIIDEDDKESYLSNTTWNEYRDIFRFKLNTPSEITYNNDNVISWKGSSLAENYIIRINGKDAGVTTECTYCIPEERRSNKLSISIKAVSNNPENMNSRFSDELIIDRDAFKTSSENGELVLKEYTGSEENIILPPHISVIDEGAFYNNLTLKSITLSKELKIIKANAFYRCRNLVSVILPETLEEIGDYAFWGTGITGNITLPSSLKKIGVRAFACCNSVTSVTLEATDIDAERGMFYRCLGLSDVSLPDDLGELSYNMFKGCFELEQITLPPRLKRIQTGSLASLMKMERVVIPASVSEIEENAFGSSLALKQIIVDPENKTYYDYDGILISRSDKKLVQFPPNHEEIDLKELGIIKAIGSYGFCDNAILEILVLPDSVEVIGSHAFERCTGLKSLTLGTNLSKIDSFAFNMCDNLKEIVIMSSTVPEISSDSLTNLPEDVRIYVDPDNYDEYALHDIWQKYLTRIIKKEE